MERQGWDSKQIYTRLVGRYGPSQGLYLFGEFCLMMSVGLEAFQRRHTPAQMRALEALLRPLQLWPFEYGPPAPQPGEAAGPMPEPPLDPLELVARTLLTSPLQLALGPDLFQGCVAWAASEPGALGDPGAWFESARAALTETLGFTPPKMTVVLGDGLESFQYRLFVLGRAVEEGWAFPGLDLVLGPENAAPPLFPYPWEPDPAVPGWVAWMPIGEGAEPPEDLPRVHWMTAISRHLSAAMPRHAADLLSVRAVHELLLEAEYGGYDHELERYLSVPELRYVFQTLLRQGVPLRPLPKMLEGMLRHILADLSRRKLAHEELEKINRQLPFFPSRGLVAIARTSLGLSPEPPPKFNMPPPPPPERPSLAWPEGPDQARWEALFALRAETRQAALFWVRTFRHGTPRGPRWEKAIAAWSLALGRDPAPLAEPATVFQAIDTNGQVEAAARMLDGYATAYREIGRVEQALQDPAHRTSPELVRSLDEPAWERWRWALNGPRRWVVAMGQESAFHRFRDGLDVPSSGCEIT